ncbi:hypothetical protein [Ornithinibacillus sp. FSL M8-0202]|uniref:hypothetical protein n=1 Tax=unclassified Ornithinibacillus TaxID=2620869 RepID=UPI0030D0C03C
MKQIDGNQILKLGKKHKKWNEDVTIEGFPYLINNSRYFLANYLGKLSKDLKNIAIITPDTMQEEDALKAIKPLVYFSIAFDRVENNTKGRAELDFSVYEEIRDYLRNILNSGVLKTDLLAIYERSLKIIEKNLHLQQEMLALREEVTSIAKRILARSYFVDSEIDEILNMVPAPGWIQYEQLYDSYKYRHDFDVVYENQNNVELKPFFNFRDPKTLYNMTSKIAEHQLRNSLDNLTDSIDMSTYSKEEYFNYWTTKFKKGLSDRYVYLSNIIRYP